MCKTQFLLGLVRSLWSYGPLTLQECGQVYIFEFESLKCSSVGQA